MSSRTNGKVPELGFAPRTGGEPPEETDLELMIEFGFDSHYDVLGVPPNASVPEIKDAAAAVRKIHSTKAMAGDSGAGTKVVQVTEAVGVLSKDDKRAEFDKQPDAIHLSVKDPLPLERVEWADGLELIRGLLSDPSHRDPIVERTEAADRHLLDDRPNQMLDELLARG